MTLPEMEDDVDEAALKGIEEHMDDHLREAAEAHMGPLVAEVRRLTKVAAAWSGLYRARCAYHNNSTTTEWNNLEAAKAGLRALGIEP